MANHATMMLVSALKAPRAGGTRMTPRAMLRRGVYSRSSSLGGGTNGSAFSSRSLLVPQAKLQKKPVVVVTVVPTAVADPRMVGAVGVGGQQWHNNHHRHFFSSSSSSSETDTAEAAAAGSSYFRPRRPSTYGRDRIISRAIKPRGPTGPNSLHHLQLEAGNLTGGNNNNNDDDYDDDGWEDGGHEYDVLGPGGSGGASASAAEGKKLLLSSDDGFIDNLNPEDTARELGPAAAETLRRMLRERQAVSDMKKAGRDPNEVDPYEEVLRDVDYYSSDFGSTEELMGSRRALSEFATEEERESVQRFLDSVNKEEEDKMFKFALGTNDDDEESEEPNFQLNQEAIESEKAQTYDIKPHHDWSETIVRVDRVQKVQRGGTRVRYRCLVVGGNLNGVAGFGIGKANGPQEAALLASKLCKKNIFFVDRYMGSGLTTNLVGKHNSLRVHLRCESPGYGLRGNDLVQEILIFFGITDCSSKTFGNRNMYNVVRATFKALMTHESLEEIAMKRGRRLVNVERARRLGFA